MLRGATYLRSLWLRVGDAISPLLVQARHQEEPRPQGFDA
jgi:hypothetical protein